LNRFFEYLALADPKDLSIAKEELPWKFDRHLSKKQALRKKKQNSQLLHVQKYLYPHRYIEETSP
jgi:hypothetical protein